MEYEMTREEAMKLPLMKMVLTLNDELSEEEKDKIYDMTYESMRSFSPNKIFSKAKGIYTSVGNDNDFGMLGFSAIKIIRVLRSKEYENKVKSFITYTYDNEFIEDCIGEEKDEQ